jgi:hypothetical protein
MLVASVTTNSQQNNNSQIGLPSSNSIQKMYIKIDVSKDYFIGVSIDTFKPKIAIIPNKAINAIEFTSEIFDLKNMIPYESGNKNQMNDENTKAAETVKRYYQIGVNEKTNPKELLNIVEDQFLEGQLKELEKEKINKQFNGQNIDDFIGYKIYVENPGQLGDQKILVKEYWKNYSRYFEQILVSSAK